MLKRMFLNIAAFCLIANMLSVNVYGSDILLSSEAISDTPEATADSQLYGDDFLPSDGGLGYTVEPNVEGQLYDIGASPSGLGIVGIEGNSIAIQSYASNVTLGDSAIGDLVKLNVGGQPYDFIVVHKGKPSSIYDDSFNDGVILLMKDIYENRQIHSSDVNDYANSTIHNHLNGTFLNLFEQGIRDAIVQVKIPYRPGSGTSTTVYSGANGLIAQIFLPSQIEVSSNKRADLGVDDGSTWDYFAGLSYSSTGNKRIVYVSGVATAWWLRSPVRNGTVEFFRVHTDGHAGWGWQSTTAYGIRPALVLPNSLLVSDDGFVMPAQSSGGDPIVPVPGLPDGLTDFLIGLIIPGDNFWNRQYTVFSDKFQDKLPYGTYIDVISSLNNIAEPSSGFSDIDFDFNGRSLVIPLSIVNPFLEVPRLIIRGLFTILLAYYNYRQILFLIRGATYSSMGDGGNS